MSKKQKKLSADRQSLLEEIKREEGDGGFKHYNDVGNDAIGYGHNITDAEKEAGNIYGIKISGDVEDLTITKEQAETILKGDVAKKIALAKKLVPNIDSMSEELQNQIVSSIFRGGLSGSPKTLKLLNEGKFEEASEEFLDNREYKSKSTTAGVKRRMKKLSDAIRSEKFAEPEPFDPSEESPEEPARGPEPIPEPIEYDTEPVTGTPLPDNYATGSQFGLGEFGGADELAATEEVRDWLMESPDEKAEREYLDDDPELVAIRRKKHFEDDLKTATASLDPTATTGLDEDEEDEEDFTLEIPSDEPVTDDDEDFTLEIPSDDDDEDFTLELPSDDEDFALELPTETLTQGEAAYEGLKQGTTFGFSDEIEGAVGFLQGDDYEKVRDEARARAELAQRDWKSTYTAAELASGVGVGILIPGSLIFRGKTLASVAGAGAVEGAAAGTGYSKGETSAEVLMDAGLGAVLGGTLAGAMSGVVQGMGRAIKAHRVNVIKGDDLDDIIGRTEATAIHNARADEATWRYIGSDDLEDVLLDENKFLSTVGDDVEFYKEPPPRVKPKEDGDGFKSGEFGPKLDSKGEPVPETRGSVEDVLDDTVVVEGPTQITEEAVALELNKNLNYTDGRAYYKWKNDIIGYMEYVVQPPAKAAKKKASRIKVGEYDPPKLEDEKLAELIEKFKQAKKSGKVTEDSFRSYKTGQYLADSVDQSKKAFINNKIMEHHNRTDEAFNAKNYDEDFIRRAELMWKEKFANDPLNKLNRKFLDAGYALRMIDDKTSLDLEMLSQKSYKANNIKTGFDRVLLEFHSRNAKRLRKKTSMTDEELLDAVEGRTKLTGAKAEVVEAYRDSWEYLLTRSREEGLQLESLGRNYVPMRKKQGVDAILAFENYYKENRDRISKSFVKTLNEGTEDEVIKFLEKAQAQDRETGLFIHYLKKHLNRDNMSLDEIDDVFENGVLRGETSLRASTNPQLGAAFKRKGLIPDFLREKNMDMLFFTNVDQTSKAAFIQPVAKEFDSRIAVLNEMGMKESSSYVYNYRMDLIGAYRGSFANKVSDVRSRYNLWASDKNAMIKGAPEIVDIMGQTIYSNLLGANVKTIVRNLTQPLVMTVPDMGWLYGTKHATGAYKEMAKRMAKGGWKEVMDEVENVYRLKPISMKSEDFEGVRRGVDSYARGRMATARKVIDNYSNVVMSMFTKTDEINRAVTLEMSKRMSAEIISKNLTKGTREAVNKLPGSLRRRVLRLMKLHTDMPKEAAKIEKTITSELAAHYVTTTQLAYGKVGMHELGREMGPFMSMLTKWPVAITSEVYYQIQRDAKGGGKRVLSKFFAPLIAASLLTRAVLDTDDPKVKKFIGKEGFGGWLPVHSMFKAPDVLVPVNVQTPFELGERAVTSLQRGMSGTLDENDFRGIKNTARRAVQQYVPVVGGLWRAHENNVLPFIEE